MKEKYLNLIKKAISRKQWEIAEKREQEKELQDLFQYLLDWEDDLETFFLDVFPEGGEADFYTWIDGGEHD